MIRAYYYQLIGKKVLGEDQRLMDFLINKRKEALQHRISCRVVFYANNRILAVIKIYSILLEHRMDILEYWTNKAIDPTDFKTDVMIFRSKMEEKGIKNVIVEEYPIERSVIKQINTTFTFA